MSVPLMLTFVSTVVFAIQLLIFAYLYSSHRVRFFQYLLLAWGAYTLSKGLKLVDVLVLNLLTRASSPTSPPSPRSASRWPPPSRTGGTIGCAGATCWWAPAP